MEPGRINREPARCFPAQVERHQLSGLPIRQTMARPATRSPRRPPHQGSTGDPAPRGTDRRTSSSGNNLERCSAKNANTLPSATSAQPPPTHPASPAACLPHPAPPNNFRCRPESPPAARIVQHPPRPIVVDQPRAANIGWSRSMMAVIPRPDVVSHLMRDWASSTTFMTGPAGSARTSGLESRVTNVGSKSARVGGGVSPGADASDTTRVVIASTGWRSVVSRGRASADTPMSSKPMIRM